MWKILPCGFAFLFWERWRKGRKVETTCRLYYLHLFSFDCCPLSSLVSSVLRCPVGKICFCFLPEFRNCLFSRFWFKIWFHPYSLCHRIVLTTTGHKSPAGLRHKRGVSIPSFESNGTASRGIEFPPPPWVEVELSNSRGHPISLFLLLLRMRWANEAIRMYRRVNKSTESEWEKKKKKKKPEKVKSPFTQCIQYILPEIVSGCQLIKVHGRRSFGRRFQPLLVMLLDRETIGKRMKHLRKRGIAFYSVSPVLWSFEKKKDNVNMVWKNKREKRRDWNE